MFKVGQLVTVNIPSEFVHSTEEFFTGEFSGGTLNVTIIAVDESTLCNAGYRSCYNPAYPIAIQLPDTIATRDNNGRLNILTFSQVGTYYEEWEASHPWLSKVIPLQRRKSL